MFRIRKEQIAAFREEAIRDFEDEVLAHVRRCFAERWAVMGEGGAREVIRIGVARAGAYGIVAGRDVCKFIDLMLVFGMDFDQTSGWAREILEREGPEDPRARMQALHERGVREA